MQAIENGMVVGAQEAWDSMFEETRKTWNPLFGGEPDFPLFEAKFVCCECGSCICEGEKYLVVDDDRRECLSCVMEDMRTA